MDYSTLDTRCLNSRTPVRLERCLPEVQSSAVPSAVLRAGEKATRKFIEFFVANIRNKNTRAAYHTAVRSFFARCDWRGVTELGRIEPVIVAAYVEDLGRRYSVPTVKQHLAAIRMLFDSLVVGQVIPSNPATSVRGPRYVIERGKTPVLSTEEARLLLDSIDVGSVIGLRDQALIATMVYTFARVSAVVGMKVDDYYQNGKRYWLRLHEKGGRFHEVPAHHSLEAYLDSYIAAAGRGEEDRGPLFRTVAGRTGRLTTAPISRNDVFRMIRRRAKDAGLTHQISCHTFRATGITAFILGGGSLENAQIIAAHSSPRTIKLYDRTSDQITLDEIERIVI